MPTREARYEHKDGTVEVAVLRAGPVTNAKLQKLQSDGVEMGKLKMIIERRTQEFKRKVRAGELKEEDEEKFLSAWSQQDVLDSGIELSDQFDKPIETVKLLLKKFSRNDQEIPINGAVDDDWIDDNLSQEIFDAINEEAAAMMRDRIPLASQGG